MSVEIQMYRSVLGLLMISTILAVQGCSMNSGDRLEKVVEENLEGRYYATIVTPAGQRESDEDFLPAPFNLGTANSGTVEVALLRDALARGSSLAIDPVGAIVVDSGGVERVVVVAVPTEQSLRTLNLDNLEDLLTEYESVRNMTQAWIVNHKGFGAFELVGWKDEQFARSVLDETQ